MKKLLVIGFIWPEPKTTAAGNRMLQLLEAFLSKDYQITFTSTAQKTPYSHDLAKMDITEETIQLNDSSFDVFVRGLQPDVVLFDRFMIEEQFGWRVAENCPSALRVLNTEDLHSLREYREKCAKKGEKFNHSKWLRQDKTKREITSIYRSDLTLLVSFVEKEVLENKVGIHGSLLMCLPFMLPQLNESNVFHWPRFEDRRDFISFGNGKHAPNVDSFQRLKRNIWPLIRNELPKAKLHIYGAYLPQQIMEMHQPKEGFLVHGWVERLEEKVQEAKVVLAPLYFGAGIKGKLTTAMQCGTPSVTTKIGIEGMSASLPWSGMVGDKAEEFATAAIALYQDEEKWVESQKNGVAIVNSIYSSVELQKSLMDCLDYLSENLVKHRNKNVIGGLLLHQTLAATKFMGKWIEAKNRIKKV